MLRIFSLVLLLCASGFLVLTTSCEPEDFEPPEEDGFRTLSLFFPGGCDPFDQGPYGTYIATVNMASSTFTQTETFTADSPNLLGARDIGLRIPKNGGMFMVTVIPTGSSVCHECCHDFCEFPWKGNPYFIGNETVLIDDGPSQVKLTLNNCDCCN